jgi:glucosyl-3-phosphoglycerate synthase
MFARNTTRDAEWELDRLLAARAASAATISAVVLARDEAGTICSYVVQILTVMLEEAGLVDDLVVMDSQSSDATTRTRLMLVPMCTRSRTYFPMTASKPAWASRSGIHLERVFYERVMDGDTIRSGERGCLTEQVARRLIAARWPHLGAVVQSLTGEWSIRRSFFETLSAALGYDVELAALIDTATLQALDAVAQVDLGACEHRHQSVSGPAAIELELIGAVEARRRGSADPIPEMTLARFRPRLYRKVDGAHGKCAARLVECGAHMTTVERRASLGVDVQRAEDAMRQLLHATGEDPVAPPAETPPVSRC